MAESITIDKSYLDTLLRRAAFYDHPNQDYPSQTHISIPKIDHDTLLRDSREYGALRRALVQGGITKEALDTLIKSELAITPVQSTSFQRPTESPFHNNAPWYNSNPGSSFPQPYMTDNTALPTPALSPPKAPIQREFDFDDDAIESPDFEDSDDEWQQVTEKVTGHRERRSLIFKNLAPSTELQDIVHALRGGTILDIYVGSKDSQAFVSFVEASSAKAFLNWVSRVPLRINGHNIHVQYADKSFWTPKHVAKRIQQGATRNLLLRGMPPDFDEDRIREDLEHIHNLVIVEVYRPENGNGLVISTNAIHLALFARTCMRSRALYKKAQISFCADRCAERSIPSFQAGYNGLSDKTNGRKPAKIAAVPVNRFHLLNLDDEDGSESNVSY